MSVAERERNVLSCTWIVILNVTVPSSLSLSFVFGVIETMTLKKTSGGGITTF